MRSSARRRAGGIATALCAGGLALVLGLPSTASQAAPDSEKPEQSTKAETAFAQGPPERPEPGPDPDPSLPVHELARADAPLDNPLKGFARFYTPGADQNTGYPHALTWSYFGLSQIMSDPSDCGNYDWSMVEQALNESAEYGNHSAIRFYMEYPDGSGSHPENAIPPCFDGNVTYRENEHWGTTSPD